MKMAYTFSIQKSRQYSEKQQGVDGVLRASVPRFQVCCAIASCAWRTLFNGSSIMYLGDCLHDMSAGARKCDCTCWLDCLTAEGLGGR